MKIGFIGLGRMGKSMVLNLLEKKHEIVVYNRSEDKTKEMEKEGAIATYSIKEMISKLPERKVIWLMIKSGKPVDDMIKQILPSLKKGDIIIDGGNSYYKDSKKRFEKLKKKRIGFIDVGTSGGMSGARNGACMMIGGDKNDFWYTEQLFKDMCVENGYGYFGESGNGHYVKMVHNGIEYGMMAALAEGFSAIKNHDKNINLTQVAKVYSNGSIVEGKLSNWLYDSFKTKDYLDTISGEVPKGETEGEMESLVKESKMKILESSIKMRKSSRKKPTYEGKLIAAMRNQFGGHAVKKK